MASSCRCVLHSSAIFWRSSVCFHRQVKTNGEGTCHRMGWHSWGDLWGGKVTDGGIWATRNSSDAGFHLRCYQKFTDTNDRSIVKESAESESEVYVAEPKQGEQCNEGKLHQRGDHRQVVWRLRQSSLCLEMSALFAVSDRWRANDSAWLKTLQTNWTSLLRKARMRGIFFSLCWIPERILILQYCPVKTLW